MTAMFRMNPQPGFNFGELVIDNFAGGGGASTGIEAAIGRSVDIAINHDIDAIRMHETNHPHTRHYCESVWEVDPRQITNGQPVALAWFSPDCKHFSKAKGGKPVEKSIRGLAWVAVRYAATVKPRVIMLENVEEFVTWGPLKDDRPCPKNKGRTFKSFVNALNRLGYQVDHRELVAADYGAPTSRKRFFLIARSDDEPIRWPEPTHGKPDSPEVLSGQRKPWRTAAEIIDWSIPCPSIFDRKRPLAENTLKRIAKGIQKFVIDNPNPYIVNDVTPFITEHANASSQRNMRADEPMRTLCAQVKGGHFAVVAPVIERQFSKADRCAAFMAKHNGGATGHPLGEPLHTVTGRGTQLQVTTSHLIKMRNNCTGSDLNEPAPTITAGGQHLGEVRAFLLKYYGNERDGCDLNAPIHTVPTRDRFGLVMVRGEPYQIVDIGMRMLQPHELYAATSFPSDYIITHDHTGKAMTKTAQVARCGNAVPPVLAEALVRANLVEVEAGAIAA